MAIQTTAVVRAQCDACPQVVYADSPAEPKGFQLDAREVDGNGKVTAATAFACQPNHVGKAIQNALKQAKAGIRPQGQYEAKTVSFPAPAPALPPVEPEPVNEYGEGDYADEHAS